MNRISRHYPTRCQATHHEVVLRYGWWWLTSLDSARLTSAAMLLLADVKKRKWAIRSTGRRWSPFLYPSARHQFTLQIAVYMFTSQLSLVHIAPTHGGMARLSWPGPMVTYQDGLPAYRRSPIQVLTGTALINIVDATALTLQTEPNRSFWHRNWQKKVQ